MPAVVSEEQVRAELVRRRRPEPPSWWDWAGRLALLGWGVVYIVQAVQASETWPRLAPVFAVVILAILWLSFRKGTPQEVLPAEIEKATAGASVCERCAHVVLVEDTQCPSCGKFRVPRDLWIPVVILVFPLVAAGIIALLLWALSGR
jgi:hypothetical protein